MILDPDTVCARTASGESELQLATHGLALGQRRVLTLLESPRSVANLAAEHRLDVEKLDRDLARLAEMKLIVVLPGRPLLDGVSERNKIPVGVADVGRNPRGARIMAAVVGTAALGVALVVFLGARETLERDAKPSAQLPLVQKPVVVPTVLKESAVVVDARPTPATEVTPLPAIVLADPRAALATAAAEPKPGRGALPVTPTLPVARPGLAPFAGRPDAAPVTPPLFPTFVSAPAIGIATATAQIDTSVPSPTSSAAKELVRSGSPPSPLPTTAPPVQLAAVAPPGPLSRPAAATDLRALSREPPAFPREAKAAGVTAGNVKARLALDAQGKVTNVEIVAATPPRVFDRAVRAALSRWTFEPGSGVFSTDVEIVFKPESSAQE